MRELTEAEYRVIAAILSHPTTPDLQRMRDAQLPSSTFNVARRRIFEGGGLRDILVPNPGPCGFAAVEFVVARPSTSTRPELLRGWAGSPDCVVLWAGMHALFGVFFREDPPPAPVPGTREEGFRLTVRREEGSVPVYFDFAGLWARFGGERVPASYPAALETGGDVADRRSLGGLSRLLEAGGPGADVPGGWTSVARMPRAERGLLDDRILLARTVLRPARMPPMEGRRLGEYVFVHGRFRPGGGTPKLLERLTGECRSFPFLLAEADGRVLLGAIGQLSSTRPGRVPVPAAERPVLAVLREQLDPFEVLVEPVEAVEEFVAHRYRVPGAGPGAPARPRPASP